MKVPSRIIFKAIEVALDFVGSLFTRKKRYDPAKFDVIPITWSEPPDTPTAPAIPRRMPPRKPRPAATTPPEASGAASPTPPRRPPRRH
jgi:hypothetical protein